jgi:cell division protein FtsW
MFLKRQLVNAAVGLVVFLCAARIDYRFWSRVSRLAILLAFIALIALFLAEKVRGAQNWLSLPGARTFQPVEFARLALIVFLASEMARLGPRLSSFREGFMPLLVVTCGIVLLVIKHNDFGSAMALCLITFTLFFVGGVRLLHLAGAGLALMGAAAAVAMVRPHVFERFRAFLHPEAYASGLAYQSLQSQTYIGSGGLFGKGLGQGVAKYGYLPDAHTDFIFSVMGEEIGFIGCVVVLSLFLLLVARSVRVARNQEEPFGQLVALGVGMAIFWYLMLNVLVATRLFPVTGLPMPFISYGGSALVSHLFAVGILCNIALRTEAPRAVRRRPWLARRQRSVEVLP